MTAVADDLVPGAKVTWLQYTPSSGPVIRTGEIWDRAPDVDGSRATAWVKPDQPELYDPYALVAVGIASRKHLPVHGRYVDEAPNQYVGKGQLFTSSLGSSPLGGLGAFAARQAGRDRKANQAGSQS